MSPIVAMYLEFYGFREMPFNITPDPKFLFLSPTHLEALQHLRYGIEEKKGFIVLTGEVGCGKTTLCRKLLEELDDRKVETALILNPRLSETQILQAILRELGFKKNFRSRNDLLDALNNHLLSLIEQGKDIVLIIDESQNMTFEALEHVRLLSNLETNTQKLLQIILIGQPELKRKLEREELRQLRQRVLVYCELQPLSVEQVGHYIQHRISLAGGNGRPTFTPRAIKSIHRRSKGIPRIINNLCDKALLAAYVKSSDQVTWWEARRAIKESKLT
ncbi:MAG: AAA family ATPase [Verrucomicrobia bacterium]|nr:AAA family ATPase [Verrucomicrobiota bacterium]